MRYDTWKPLNRPELGIANRISLLVSRQVLRDHNCLPDFGSTDRLLVGCDFSGDSRRTYHKTLSILLVDARAVWLWDKMRMHLRAKFFSEPRRIAFKNITERQRAAALVPFLRAANALSGVIFTLVIDHEIESLFRPDNTIDSHSIALAKKLDQVDKDTRERLFILGHALGLLLNGLSHPDQDVLIISDEDSIFANDNRHRLACDVLRTILSHYLSHSLGKLQVATTQSDTGRLDLEDLVAIPDLCAGALTECAGLRDGRGGLPVGLLRPIDRLVSRKSQAILAWYAENWHPLKRMAIKLEHAAPDGILGRELQVIPERPIPEYDWRADAYNILANDPSS